MINLVILVGNLGADPELRYTPGGDAVCNFNIATNRRWKDRNSGEMKEETEWHRIVLWRENAENAAKYLKKGKKVFIQGEIRTRSWETNEGETRYTTEIQGRIAKFLDPSDGQGSGGGGGGGGGGGAPPNDDDLPF